MLFVCVVCLCESCGAPKNMLHEFFCFIVCKFGFSSIFKQLSSWCKQLKSRWIGESVNFLTRNYNWELLTHYSDRKLPSILSCVAKSYYHPQNARSILLFCPPLSNHPPHHLRLERARERDRGQYFLARNAHWAAQKANTEQKLVLPRVQNPISRTFIHSTPSPSSSLTTYYTTHKNRKTNQEDRNNRHERAAGTGEFASTARAPKVVGKFAVVCRLPYRTRYFNFT